MKLFSFQERREFAFALQNGREGGKIKKISALPYYRAAPECLSGFFSFFFFLQGVYHFLKCLFSFFLSFLGRGGDGYREWDERCSMQ